MKTLYFDCFAGISGDMTLGALIDLGIDKDLFVSELSKLNVDGYKIKFGRATKNGINANDVDVVLTESEHHEHESHENIHGHEHAHEHEGHEHIHKYEHTHEHEGHEHTHEHKHTHEHEGHEHIHEHEHHEHTHSNHVHRNLYDVNKIIDDSEISDNAKGLAKRIFMRVALAESKVHGETLENVHFHEVGAIDSIVDIIGTAICIDILKPDKIFASVVNDGYGFVMCQHGQIPVPVPATAEIFANSEVIFKQIDIPMELVTPTGAAIIAELAESYGVMPQMKIERIGLGAGKRTSKIPNVLRVSMGELIEDDNDTINVLETNLDDCTGEILGYTMERLFESGAKDVFYSPVIMKKSRPAYKLTVLCDDKHIKDMENIIFKETTTIGIRKRKENRTCLKRTIKIINTKFGELEVKAVTINGKEKFYPEYESAKKLANKNNVELKTIYNEI